MSYLPPTSEGCLSVHISMERGGGVPVLPTGGGGFNPISGPGQGGYPISGPRRVGVPPSQVQDRGTPSQDGGYPHLRSRKGGGHPRSGWGIPLSEEWG